MLRAVGLGARQDAVARARRRQDPRQPAHPGPHRHRSRPPARRDQRARSRASRAEQAKTQVDGARFRWAATASPTSSAASARSCCRTRRPTSTGATRAGRRRPDQGCCSPWSLLAMSVMRKMLLAVSTNAVAARARDARRRSSAGRCRRFMPGERLEDAMAAAGAQKRRASTRSSRKLGENLTTRRRSRRGHAALPRRARQGEGAPGSTRRSRSSRRSSASISTRTLLAQSAAAGRARASSAATSSGSTWRARPTSIRRSSCSAARARRSPRIGIALQAYLYRTPKDVESARPARAGDPPRQGRVSRAARRRAIRRRPTSTRTSTRCACRLLADDAQKAGALLHIATHDPALVDRLTAVSSTSSSVPTSAYEFAMLYGIQRPLQQRLVAGGPAAARAHQLRRVLVPVVHAPARRAARERLVRDSNDVRIGTGSGSREQRIRCLEPAARPGDQQSRRCMDSSELLISCKDVDERMRAEVRHDISLEAEPRAQVHPRVPAV